MFCLNSNFKTEYFNVYWLLPNIILIGSYPSSPDENIIKRKLEFLFNLGIRSFMDLTVQGERTTNGEELFPYEDFLKADTSYKRFPINDNAAPEKKVVIKILDYIDTSVSLQIPIYIHCRGGKYRTGTVVGCYLARHNISTGVDALKTEMIIREKMHSDKIELEPEQKELVINWKVGE